METLKSIRASALTWLLGLLLALMGASAAAAPPAPPSQKESPINITAAQLEADHTKQEITFKGQVVARYQDMILYADILKIFYEGGKEAAAPPAAAGGEPPSPLGGLGVEKIARIEAHGHVRLVQEDKVASGDTAVYYKKEEKIVLTGHPQLWRGESSIKGDKITFFLADNRAEVSGAAQKRVEATIVPSPTGRASGKPKLPLPGQ